MVGSMGIILGWITQSLYLFWVAVSTLFVSLLWIVKVFVVLLDKIEEKINGRDTED